MPTLSLYTHISGVFVIISDFINTDSYSKVHIHVTVGAWFPLFAIPRHSAASFVKASFPPMLYMFYHSSYYWFTSPAASTRSGKLLNVSVSYVRLSLESMYFRHLQSSSQRELCSYEKHVVFFSPVWHIICRQLGYKSKAMGTVP